MRRSAKKRNEGVYDVYFDEASRHVAVLKILYFDNDHQTFTDSFLTLAVLVMLRISPPQRKIYWTTHVVTIDLIEIKAMQNSSA